MKEPEEPRYPLSAGTRIAARILNVAPAAFLQRAGLSLDIASHENVGVTAQQFYAAWRALVAESGQEDVPLVVGRALARGPLIPGLLALTWAPNLRAGLQRLAPYKVLLGPGAWRTERHREGVCVVFEPNHTDIPAPSSVSAMQCVLVCELARVCTGAPVVPRRVTLPSSESLDAYFGRSVAVGEPALVLSDADMDRPFLSENAHLWGLLEDDLKARISAQEADLAFRLRVRAVLRQQLSEGHVSIERTSAMLGVGLRTLQRGLQAEGVSYQQLLDAQRLALARRYLTRSTMSNDEISYMLAFSHPNSFYRAFREWTGLTPGEARSQWTASRSPA